MDQESHTYKQRKLSSLNIYIATFKKFYTALKRLMQIIYN